MRSARALEFNRVIRPIVICCAIALTPLVALGQNEEPTDESVFDSTYVNDLSRKWSLRLYSVAKFQTSVVRNLDNNERVKYFPRNPFGIGIGFAYRYLIIDLGINLRVDKSNPDSQFDFQGTLLTKAEGLDFFVQRYNGFRGRNFEVEEERFRNDINTLGMGMNYFHNFGYEKLSIVSAFQGGTIQKKSAGSWVVGGYWSYYRMEADSTIIPPAQQGDFNDYAQIEEARITTLGISGGYAYNFVLPSNFFFFASFTPGLGVNLGTIEAVEKYSPNVFPAGKLNFRAAIGRATEKHYVILSFNIDRFLVDIENRNRFKYNTGRLKLVVGFRMKSKLQKVDEVLPDL